MSWYLAIRRNVPAALCPAAGRIVRVSLGAVMLAAAAGCAGSPGSGGQPPSAHPPTTAASPWAQIDRELTALAPDTGLLVARVSRAGTCVPVNQVAAATPRPLGSMFKLFVLGALARQIGAGRVSWSQQLTVTDALKSPGSGSLQYDPAGTRVSVRQAAAKMISISDNTAADMLIRLAGRAAVQAQVRRWSAHAALDVPFLTTREMFLLKDAGYPALADRYLRLDPALRAAFLASRVDPLPLSRLAPRGWTQPRDIATIEWFASPDDLCRAFAGLRQLASQPGLAPVGAVMSANNGGIGLGRPHWPVVWYKGGDEPGVLTGGYLATNSKGQTFVVVAMLENPSAWLYPSASIGLQAVISSAFETLSPEPYKAPR